VGITEKDGFEGRSSDLVRKISAEFQDFFKINKGLSNPSIMSRELSRISAFLSKRGIEIRKSETRTSKGHTFTIRKVTVK